MQIEVQIFENKKPAANRLSVKYCSELFFTEFLIRN